jgi:prepilin-type N-terminal cleavage/methylation domain-containing protein
VTTRPVGRAGFTLLELMIALVIGSVLMIAVFGVMIRHSTEFRTQRETVDVRQTLRGAAVILTTELQGASASRGDLYAISAESLAVRSFRSTGAICGTSTKRYGVAQAAGSFGSTADDSALISKTSSAVWNPVKVDVVWTNPGSPYVATCPSWSGSPVPPTVIEIHVGAAADTAGLGVGSVVRGFQKTVYKLAQVNGRWWLTRRVGSAATYDIVTGPLRSDTDSGLVFRYYNAAGAVTATPSAVARVAIILRAESTRNVQTTSGTTVDKRRDSLNTTATLRN